MVRTADEAPQLAYVLEGKIMNKFQTGKMITSGDSCHKGNENKGKLGSRKSLHETTLMRTKQVPLLKARHILLRKHRWNSPETRWLCRPKPDAAATADPAADFPSPHFFASPPNRHPAASDAKFQAVLDKCTAAGTIPSAAEHADLSTGDGEGFEGEECLQSIHSIEVPSNAHDPVWLLQPFLSPSDSVSASLPVQVILLPQTSELLGLQANATTPSEN
ncbi:hypothetical protein AAY473_037941 [Plecturocebus cupreus]